MTSLAVKRMLRGGRRAKVVETAIRRRMKIAVVGAGAVGCYYGGMVARAGHEIVLIGRPRHIEAVLREGLLLETASFRGHLPVKASVDPRAIQGARLVLCCVKSMDTAS